MSFRQWVLFPYRKSNLYTMCMWYMYMLYIICRIFHISLACVCVCPPLSLSNLSPSCKASEAVLLIPLDHTEATSIGHFELMSQAFGARVTCQKRGCLPKKQASRNKAAPNIDMNNRPIGHCKEVTVNWSCLGQVTLLFSPARTWETNSLVKPNTTDDQRWCV